MNTLARNLTALKPILPVQFNKIYISDSPNLRISNTPQMQRNPRQKLKTIPYGPPTYTQALVQLVQQRRLSPRRRRRRQCSQIRSIFWNKSPDLRISSRPPQLVFSNKETEREREKERERAVC